MKMLNGIVISTKMTNTAVVSVENIVRHPMYKKELRRHKKYKADTKGITVGVGDTVSMVEIKPMSKGKNFKVSEVLEVAK